MYVGRIVGTVVATRKDTTLVGTKLLIVQPLNLTLRPTEEARVMVDTVGAGVGELVIFATGTAARNALNKKDSAADAAIIGIVDKFETNDHWI
ncbi:MAG: EutN/CcmL family microcompartment protein [Synergistaceae bacterium]|jgi:ethanolamine utilization protein EutN|nr:EutN/CcmL family microcompartment protein [Synergistaceae bacterium]